MAAGNEAQRSIDLNSKPDYREKLNEELREMRESEMWQTGAVVRKLRRKQLTQGKGPEKAGGGSRRPFFAQFGFAPVQFLCIFACRNTGNPNKTTQYVQP